MLLSNAVNVVSVISQGKGKEYDEYGDRDMRPDGIKLCADT